MLRGEAGNAWLGNAALVTVMHGRAGQAWTVRREAARQVMAGKARHAQAWCDEARSGNAASKKGKSK